MIYADNAATTELDKEAFKAMRPFLLENFGNASQPYSFGKVAQKAVKSARQTIADCIGAVSEEIFFTSGGTESDNWAIKMAAGLDGDIITSVIEHHAVLNSCASLERKGRKVIYIPVSETGTVDPKCVEENITDNTKLISVMFANNEIGTIQPIKELAEIAHRHNCLFHTDAVQAVGHIKVDVRELGVDLLSASSHKFNGPKGMGFLYIKKDVQLESYMDGGRQEAGQRAGTENVAFIVATAVALEKNCKSIISNDKYLRDLETVLIDKLDAAKVDYIRNGGRNRIPGNISLSFKGCEGEMILHRMDLKGICISTGSACDSMNTQVSHVIKAIGISDEYAEGTVRISFGKDNTKDEAVVIADALLGIVQ